MSQSQYHIFIKLGQHAEQYQGRQLPSGLESLLIMYTKMYYQTTK